MLISLVYDRKEAAVSPYEGFYRNSEYSRGTRKQNVSHSSLEMSSLTHHGPIHAGDIMTLGIERMTYKGPFSILQSDVIRGHVYLLSARVIYKTRE